MIVTSILTFFMGAVLGLRFNVKMLALVSIATMAVWTTLGVTGHAASPVLSGILSLVVLQIGYFTAIVLAAMGYANSPETDQDEASTNASANTSAKPARSPIKAMIGR